MVDEKDELPDLNEDPFEDGTDDDFLSAASEDEELLDGDFGDIDVEISTEEEGGESFEEVAEGDDLSIGDDDDFFSSGPGDDVSLEVEVEEEPMPDLSEPEEEFAESEPEAEDVPVEESLVGDILGAEGEGPLSSFPKEDRSEESAELPEEKGAKKKKTGPLLVLLLLLAAAYGTYAYIIPGYFPELLSPSQPATPVRAPAPAPERIAVKPPQKQAAPKPAPAEEPKVATEKAKVESMPAGTAPVKEEVKPESGPKKALAIPAEKPRVAKAPLPVEGDQGFLVQAGAFIFESNIKGPISKIMEAGYTPRVKTSYKLIPMNRLTVGGWGNFEEANTAALDLLEQGYKRAKVLPLSKDKFAVLIGSYYYKHLAVEESIILEVKGFDTEIVEKPVRMKVYHILLGPYADAEELAKVEEALKEKGLETAVLKNKNW